MSGRRPSSPSAARVVPRTEPLIACRLIAIFRHALPPAALPARTGALPGRAASAPHLRAPLPPDAGGLPGGRPAIRHSPRPLPPAAGHARLRRPDPGGPAAGRRSLQHRGPGRAALRCAGAARARARPTWSARSRSSTIEPGTAPLPASWRSSAAGRRAVRTTLGVLADRRRRRPGLGRGSRAVLLPGGGA